MRSSCRTWVQEMWGCWTSTLKAVTVIRYDKSLAVVQVAWIESRDLLQVVVILLRITKERRFILGGLPAFLHCQTDVIDCFEGPAAARRTAS